MAGKKDLASSRREFLWALPAGCLLCGACQQLNKGEQALVSSVPVHRFDLNTGMTARQIIDQTYSQLWIPILERMAAKLGREDFVRLLKESASEATARMVQSRIQGRPFPIAEMARYYQEMMQAQPFQNMIDFEVLEVTDSAMEYEVHECLLAEVFRNAGAEDFGYAVACFPDFAAVQTLNSDLKLERDQNLMQGDPYCHARISFAV